MTEGKFKEKYTDELGRKIKIKDGKIKIEDGNKKIKRKIKHGGASSSIRTRVVATTGIPVSTEATTTKTATMNAFGEADHGRMLPSSLWR